MVLLVIAVALWLTCAGITIAALKPDSPADGALVLVLALFGWPLIALGWLVSRPWA